MHRKFKILLRLIKEVVYYDLPSVYKHNMKSNYEKHHTKDLYDSVQFFKKNYVIIIIFYLSENHRAVSKGVL